jgi:hypothetical protein
MKNWFLHPVYTVGSFFLAVAVFFLVPLPWYFALLAAIGTYFVTGVLSGAMLVITRQDSASAAERAVDEYNKRKQSGTVMSTFFVDGTPRPASYVAAQIHHVWVDNSVQRFVEGFFDRKPRYLPANLRGPFAHKVRLYCEASVLRVLTRSPTCPRL